MAKNVTTKTLLVVDDEPLICGLIEESLKTRNLNVLSTSDPTQVSEIISTKAVDAVITDFNMPIKNGLEVLKDIRRIKGKDFPVILLSGALDLDEDALGHIGTTYFMKKPLDFYKLELLLEKELHYFNLLSSDDFRSIEYDGQIYGKKSGKGVRFEFVELRDRSVAIGSHLLGASLGTACILSVKCTFNGDKEGSYYFEGRVSEINWLEEGKDLMIIEFEDESVANYREFKIIYDQRQTAIREFMEAAKGL